MLQVKNVTFSYKEDPVLNDISFSVGEGEHLSIIGESGSGKSTLLKLLYGVYDINEGEISWNSKHILGPEHNLVIGSDFIKYVAQEFDLMPFTTVGENVGEFLSNVYPEKKQERILELLEVVELTEFIDIKVKSLSGGQKQRVALAKAIAKQPEIILLDEPFSHIDNFKKQSLRRRLFRYLKFHNITCIVATHDKNDVLGYTDRMLVIHNHKLIANGPPEHLYNNPITPLVASFFGEFNTINGQIIYAYQLQVVSNSDIKATVRQCYFKGKNYLVEAELKDEIVFFEHDTKLAKNLKVFLEVNR